LKDQIKTCIQCNGKFIVTAREQQRLISKGFDIPKRCHECRRKKTKALNDHDNSNLRDKRKWEREKDDFFS
jgi:hypothetical protein